jgi:hypothetical protein
MRAVARRFSLQAFVHRKLAKKRRGQRIRLIALLRLWQISALDLCSAQSNVACNPSRRSVGNDIHA